MEAIVSLLLSAVTGYVMHKGADALINNIQKLRKKPLNFEEEILNYMLAALDDTIDKRYPEKDKKTIHKQFIKSVIKFKDSGSEETFYLILQESVGSEATKDDAKLFYNNFSDNISNNREFWQKFMTRGYFAQIKNDQTIMGMLKIIIDRLNLKWPSETTVTDSDIIKLPVVILPSHNHRFSGREDELNEIHNYFKKSETACVKQVIAGLGGIGKTQLALKYAHKFKDEYPHGICWVNAAESPKRDLLAFAKKLGFTSKDINADVPVKDEDPLENLYDWFNIHTNFLLIFDNVDFDPEAFDSEGFDHEDFDARDTEELKKLILRIKSGHVLITTCDRKLNLPCNRVVDLNVFTDKDAKSFVRGRLSDKIIGEEQNLNDLIKRMDRWPLALEQATAYMSDTDNNCDCQSFLSLFSEQGVQLFEDESAKPKEYGNILNTIVDTSLKKLSTPARQLIYLCAYMAPDEISLDFFKRQRKALPMPLCGKLDLDFTLNEVIRNATKHALLKRDNNFLTIHKLVQKNIQQKLTKDTSWLSYCINMVNNIFEYNGEEQETAQLAAVFIEQNTPHIKKITQHSETIFGNDQGLHEKMVELYKNVGDRFVNDKQYYEAIKWYRTVLATHRGKGQEFVADMYSVIGRTYLVMAKNTYSRYCTKKALEYLLDAYSIRKKLFGENDPRTQILSYYIKNTSLD